MTRPTTSTRVATEDRESYGRNRAWRYMCMQEHQKELVWEERFIKWGNKRTSVEVDWDREETRGMLPQGKAFEWLLRMALDGWVRGVVGGPNCRSRSVLRHFPFERGGAWTKTLEKLGEQSRVGTQGPFGGRGAKGGGRRHTDPAVSVGVHRRGGGPKREWEGRACAFPVETASCPEVEGGR